MYDSVIETLVTSKAVRATKYISPTQIIRAVRTSYGGRFSRGNVEITLTIGKPNYREREFIKLCKDAGEPFPVAKIQLKFPAKKKKIRG